MDKEECRQFIASFLIGITGDTKETAGDLLEKHKIVFSLLDDIEGDVLEDDLSKLLRDLFKEVIKDLQIKLEMVNRGKANGEDVENTN